MTAAELCAYLILAEASRQLLDGEMTPPEFIEALLAAQQYQDAMAVLSRTLPVRERIWWACYCARHSSDFGSTPAVDAAVLAAEAWVTDCSEANRYRAYDAAQLVRPGAAANCAAMAAFASGPTLAPAREKPMPPPPGLSAQLAAAAGIVASISQGREAAPHRYLFFIEQGRELLQSAVAAGN
jgi:hypothetical protein